MTTHTPGPWMIQHLESTRHGFDGWQTFAIRSRPGNHCLAVVGEVDRATDTHNEANARLIASAPELLHALAVLVNDVAEGFIAQHLPVNPESIQCVKDARAAIAKATSPV